MKLSDLEGQLYRSGAALADGGHALEPVGAVTDAHAVMFLCPKCFEANGGPVGTHSVLVAFESSPPNTSAGPRWSKHGATLADLTIRPSIHLSGPGCGWHGFVTDGAIRNV